MLYTDERYTRLIVQVENKLKKIGVITSDFDNLTLEQEEALDALGTKITKAVYKVWDETNYEDAKMMWRIQYEASELSDVIQYLE